MISWKRYHQENTFFHYQHSLELKWCREHKGWSADQWKQVIFSNEYNFCFSKLQGEFMCEGSPGKLRTLSVFFSQWSTEVDQWWFGHPYREIFSVPSLPCMDHLNILGIMLWRHLPIRQCSDTYCSCSMFICPTVNWIFFIVVQLWIYF